MATSESRATMKNKPAEKTEKRTTNVSVENLPQIKVVCPRDYQDNLSVKTDETSTGTDDVSTEPDDPSTGTYDASTGTDDASTETDDSSTGTDDSVYAPEGGWGWLVTLAGFVVAFIVDGMVASFGLMLPELLVTFDAGMSMTSLPPAILGAIYQLSGPMTAYLVRRWGCRLVGFCGGLLAALGVAASAYAPSIHLFILGFGLVAGVGVGLIYLPSITMVNVYFHKKRGMAAGIVTSGSGFGLLALAPLTEILMEEYGWRGCYLIMAAITLHFCVCASLMRPLHRPPPTPSPSTHTPDTGEGVRVVVEGEEGECVLLKDEVSVSLVSVRQVKDPADSDPLAPTTLLGGEGQDIRVPPAGVHLVEKGPVPRSRHKHFQGDDSEFLQLPNKCHPDSLFSSVKNLFLSHHGIHVPVSSDGHTHPRQGLMVRSRSQGHLMSSASPHRPHSHLHVNALSTWLACQVPPSLSRHSLHSHQSSDNMAAQRGGAGQQRGREGCERGYQVKSGPQGQVSAVTCGRSLPSVNHAEDMFIHVVLKNQLMANGFPLHSKKSSAEELPHKDPSCSYSLLPEEASSGEHSPSPEPGRERKGSVGWWVREKRVFSLFLTGAFLIQLVCNVPPLLAPSFAYQHGVSKEQVATILSVYGVLNTGGRLLAGLLVYCGVRSLHVHNVGTLLSAVACFTLPLSTSFPTIALTLGLHGFFLGAFPPLQSVILVEYLGLERLTSTFGIMCLVKAFASAAGAPLAGLLFTVTGTYTVPVAVCGGVLVLAAIFHQLMDC